MKKFYDQIQLKEIDNPNFKSQKKFLQGMLEIVDFGLCNEEGTDINGTSPFSSSVKEIGSLLAKLKVNEDNTKYYLPISAFYLIATQQLINRLSENDKRRFSEYVSIKVLEKKERSARIKLQKKMEKEKEQRDKALTEAYARPLGSYESISPNDWRFKKKRSFFS